MALNAYVTASGGEIGSRRLCKLGWYRSFGEMNPILLKPQGDMTSR